MDMSGTFEIKARAYKTGKASSVIVKETVTVAAVAKPTISLNNIHNGKNVAFECETEDVSYVYSIDDSGENSGDSVDIILPAEAASNMVLWSSSNESVATVSEDGLVTAVTSGTVKIRATEESGKYAECTVKVYTVDPA